MTPCSDAMARNRHDQQLRERIAQEAARIMATESVEDFRMAKDKAATRLGVSDHVQLPTNVEVEEALRAYQALFQEGSQPRTLQQLREVSLQAMEFLAVFNPRLVGAVLAGTASDHSPVQLHLFATTPEEVAIFLNDAGIPFDTAGCSLKLTRDERADYPGFRLLADDVCVELTVFPADGIRQAPLSPVDGRPMARASANRVRTLLADSS